MPENLMIGEPKLEALFADVAGRLQSSYTASRRDLVREARRRYAVDSADTVAVHVLAAADLLNGKPQRCLALLQRQPAAWNGDPQGHRLAGYACAAERKWEAATGEFKHAVRIDPRLYDVWQLLGGLHERRGDCQSAIAFYQRAVVFDDTQHESALALSRIYAERRDLKEAIDTLRISLLRDRRNPRLNLALARLLERRGMLLRKLGRLDALHRALENAVGCYKIVVSAAPTEEAWLALGSLQNRLGRHEEAHTAFAKAVEINPESAAALAQLGGALVDQGEMDRARELLQRSIRIDPSRANTHFRYCRAQRFRRNRESLRYGRMLVEMSNDHSKPVRQRVQLNFAAAKVLDDIGEYENAWKHYDTANRLKQSNNGHYRGSRLDVVADARRVFSPGWFFQNRGAGDPSRTPIFIVGMPRSGTTLAEQILSSHPQVAGAGELTHIERIRSRLIRDFSDRSRRAAEGQLQHATGVPRIRGTSLRYPDLINRVEPGAIAAYGQRYLSELEKYRGDEIHVTDKMPTNFLHLGLIALLFPRATIIHCQRDPMDVIVSAYCQNLNPPFCDLSAMVDYHRQYRQLMRHWQSVLPVKIHTVRYESLVADPEPVIRGMLEHCRLSWHPNCLNFESNRRSVHTPSKWQVRQPMYRTSVGKWKRFESQLSSIAGQIQRELAAEREVPLFVA